MKNHQIRYFSRWKPIKLNIIQLSSFFGGFIKNSIQFTDRIILWLELQISKSSQDVSWAENNSNNILWATKKILRELSEFSNNSEQRKFWENLRTNILKTASAASWKHLLFSMDFAHFLSYLERKLRGGYWIEAGKFFHRLIIDTNVQPELIKYF